MTFVLLYSINCKVSIFDVMAINSISVFSAVLPLSFSGLGIREFAKIKLYSMVAVPQEIAAAVAIIYTVWIYFVALIVLLSYRQK